MSMKEEKTALRKQIWAELAQMTAEELRRRSHFPQEYYGQPHFMPGYEDGRAIARLNRARCAAREAELILCQLEAPALAEPVGQVLDLARRILRCDVLEEPVIVCRASGTCVVPKDKQRIPH